MKKLMILLMLISTMSIFAKNVSGVDIPETRVEAGQNLILNGAGIRKKAFLDLYVGSLYLTGKNEDGNTIIKDKKIQVIRLDIVSKLVGSKEMEDAINDGFKASLSPDSLKSLDAKIQDFKKSFSTEEIKKGDRFEFVAKDDKVMAYKNGKLLKTIDGGDFKEGLFGIWLGNQPADKNLKASMLK